METEEDLYGNVVRRLRRNGERKIYDLKKLRDRSHRMLEMVHQGLRHKDVAEVIGCTPQTVSNTVNSSLGMARLGELKDKREEEIVKVDVEVEKRLRRCFDTYDEILEGGMASLSLKAKVADTILLRLGGYEAPKQVQGKIMHAHLAQPELIEALKESGRTALKECGDLVES